MDLNKAASRLNIARGVFGILAAVMALITFILLGANMDYANFPGANLELAKHMAGDKEGQLKEILGGYEVEPVAISGGAGTGCSNFVEAGSDDAVQFTLAVDGGKLCKNTDDPDKNLNEDWNRGWLVAPECSRTTDENACAPFASNSALGWFGRLTFITLALQVVLYGAHSCVLLTSDELGGNALSLSALKGFGRQAKSWLALTIVWLIVGAALMGTAAVAWGAFCDKIDTGLGRQINTGSDATPTMVRACATTGCTMSFGSLFASFTTALVWYRLPLIAEWFGLESAK